MCPLSWLLPRSSTVRLESLASSVGISPVNSFSPRPTSRRLVSPPISGGIRPLSLLLQSPSFPRLDRLPSSAGKCPISRLSIRSIRKTRPLGYVSTPCHSSTGSSVSQLVLLVQFGPSVALKNATSASRSLDGEPVCATVGAGGGASRSPEGEPVCAVVGVVAIRVNSRASVIDTARSVGLRFAANVPSVRATRCPLRLPAVADRYQFRTHRDRRGDRPCHIVSLDPGAARRCGDGRREPVVSHGRMGGGLRVERVVDRTRDGGHGKVDVEMLAVDLLRHDRYGVRS